MSIPNYQRFMYPFLELLRDQEEHTLQEAYRYLADYFNLSKEERAELLPSGKQLVFQNRIGWARTYLKNAGLLKNVRRGTFIITERGLEILNNPEINELTQQNLLKYEEFRKFKKINDSLDEDNLEFNTHGIQEEQLTPQEKLEESFKVLEKQVSEELLDKVKSCSPDFFERLVVELLVSMGYGGSIEDAGRAIGRSGDEGIDGIIKEDVLGLDMIYVQAKRWENIVGRPEIQKFAGSLEGMRARKGVFITTSDFTKEAREYVGKIEKKIILMNGSDLAKFMMKFNVGVSDVIQYTIKRIDLDYFEE
ncbi:restriction endonuclease [Neobacillus sp. YIM B02564]|jgi:restriction system protein|uniref:Restriction endonuclease n=1 Tax=Neobacillus paridis TaxID=2803862 RepID=A0ABS1TP23_9BACI|nr:restriction endonuclease [Neobacillus paridis]MBL4953048.1 restriction endonuclease [Neobacillus paridis]